MNVPKGSHADTRRERAVLGALMLDGSMFSAVKDLAFGAHHFSELTLREVFLAMEALYFAHIPIDAITVKDELSRRWSFDQIGGSEALIEYAESVKEAGSVIPDAKILIQLAKGRRAAATADRLAYRDATSGQADRRLR